MKGKNMLPLVKTIYDNILDGQHKVVEAKAQEALDSGIDPRIILNEGMIAAMAEVGRLFEAGEYYVPEMLIAARAMKAGLAVIKPHLVRANVKATGKVAIGTVQGDLHDIGKNLVGMMLEGAGFEILDLGTDVAPARFVDAVKNEGVDIIGLSALLTTTMPNMKGTLEALKQAGFGGHVKVMIGGAPITEEYARQIGADGYAPDASRAVDVAKSLMASS
jgi:5-methyltetrahydrofolate--homocysteine methyltransferase